MKVKTTWLYFLFYITILAVVFRTLIFNLTTHLLDWHDTPFMVWQIFQNIEKIRSFNFENFFDTSAFYPHKMTLLFSNIFLPESLFASPLTFLINNPILIFNLVFFLTSLLNYLSIFLFWNQVFRNNLLGFIGGMSIMFSPFFHRQLGHPQMQSYWPFFFSLYFLSRFQQSKDRKYLFLSGIFCFLQFTASVYLSVFLLFALLCFFLVDFIFYKERVETIKKYFLPVITFIILSLPFIIGYFSVIKQYNIKKEIKGAHLSDYLFTTNINTLLYQLPIIKRWNSFNRLGSGEKAAAPGVLFIFLSFIGLVSAKITRKKLNIKFVFSPTEIKFVFLIFFGFWFSLGPRLFFNGQYTNLPTGVNILVKYFPFLSFIRAASRWSFLFYFGIIYFALKGLEKIYKKIKGRRKVFVFSLIFAFFVLEYIPFGIKTHSEVYITPIYRQLKKECQKEKKVLLEYPVTHFNVKGGIIKGLNYISKVLLSSVYHKCYLVNGYSGYDPLYLRRLHKSLSYYLKQRNSNKIREVLKKYDVNFVKVNVEKIIAPESVEGWKAVRDNLGDIKVFISND